ncbi:head-tail adaptor protein [Mesorhizobium sp. B2-2-4]|uniref:phage head closure protein n=1 Tax=unclassified Mesorhizobium TaxID=325217 RepID=UPI00112A8584|nr:MULTISPECIES: phage head closure protein [unclassified Mesorhizobium]TPM61104.1 head-tail adaptor protein [Mesorhizobium sp. B2-2-4]TPM70536.1 head-tail adaptor protein [Mesorhizobium sp. B2-2-1]TPN70388.1 head-tail adaptor protein [Mesorhizobium sp. B1-1-3]
MRAGKLDRTITIERKTETVSETGAVVAAWLNIATVRAEIVTQSASEFLTGFGEAENGTIVFRVRYLAGITTADRVTYAGQVYDLKEVTEIARRRGLELRGVATA